MNLINNSQKSWDEAKNKDEIKVIGHGNVAEGGCPRCKSLKLIPTRKTVNGDRVYTCFECKAIFASPTTYAECEKLGIIGKDLITHDCLICPIPKQEGFDVKKLIKEGKACPYFKGIAKGKLKMGDLR